MMNQTVLNLVDILLLRGGPQHLPSSWALAALTLALYVGLGLYGASLVGTEDLAEKTLVGIGFQLVMVAAALRFRGVPERLPQTIVALTGAGFILGLFYTGLLLLAQPGVEQPALAMGWLLLVAWSLMVDAHIYRHALTVTLPIGVAVALGLFAANVYLSEILF